MYERISSITGKAWQSGVLSQRNWQSELSLTTSVGDPMSPTDPLGQSNLTSLASSKPDAEIALVPETCPVVSSNATNGDASEELCCAEARGSQYSLVRSDNMPEIVLDNVRQVERLRKKQLTSLIRLDAIRHETCPERTICTRFLVF